MTSAWLRRKVASFAMAARGVGSCIWTPSTRRYQTRVSAVHHECAGHPIGDFPGTSAGSIRAVHGWLWAFLAGGEISSANSPDIPPDATAGSCWAGRRATNRSGLAKARSAMPSRHGRSRAAVDEEAHTSVQYSADVGEKGSRFQAGAARLSRLAPKMPISWRRASIATVDALILP